MKIRVTFYKESAGGDCYDMREYPSIKSAALHCGRAPRVLSYKMRHGGRDIKTNHGTIISIEAIDGKTDGATGPVREYTDQFEENLSLGPLEVSRGWRWAQQALGKIAAAVKWCLRKFN